MSYVLHMNTLERNIEKKFRAAIVAKGGLCIKLVGFAGIPDRMVLLPGGRLRFVELKTETGKLSKVQIAVHAKLRALGFQVDTLYGHEGVNEWLDNI